MNISLTTAGVRGVFFLAISALLLITSTAPVDAASCVKPTPRHLTVTQKSTRGATINWQKNKKKKGALKRYTLTVKNKKGKTVFSRKIKNQLNKKRFSINAHTLKPDKTYSVSVQAVCNSGKKSKAKKKNFNTKKSEHAKIKNIIDTHAHVEFSSDGDKKRRVTKKMKSWDLSRAVLMETPSPTRSADSGSQRLSSSTDGSDKFTILYGGDELNYLLYALGGEATFTENAIYPNGTDKDTEADIAELEDISLDPETYSDQFKELATDAAESGKYAGFGELASLHKSNRENHPFITFPADQELMLWLSDLAAENNMFLDIHMEVTDEKIDQLERLLSHNENTPIVWDHAGWWEGKQVKPSLYRSLLDDHPNLYLQIKIRRDSFGPFTPLTKKYRLRSQWKKLFTKYGDRIMLGSDFKINTNSRKAIEREFWGSVEPVQVLLDLLPKKTAKKVGRKTAQTLLGL